DDSGASDAAALDKGATLGRAEATERRAGTVSGPAGGSMVGASSIGSQRSPIPRFAGRTRPGATTMGSPSVAVVPATVDPCTTGAPGVTPDPISVSPGGTGGTRPFPGATAARSAEPRTAKRPTIER